MSPQANACEEWDAAVEVCDDLIDAPGVALRLAVARGNHAAVEGVSYA